MIDLFVRLNNQDGDRSKSQKPDFPGLGALPILSLPQPHPHAHSCLLHRPAIPSPLLASDNSPSSGLSAPTRSINHDDSSPPALGGLGSSQSQGHEVPSSYKWVYLIDELTGIVQPPVRADETADL